ncbi:hypothetical protein [Hungatella sp.]|uniref:hypothetical protein n=1 Tax=Hungatella sp. TaxID=2613924 RepID=UPI003AB507F1
MSTEIIKQEETNGEKAAVLSFLLISAAFLMVEIGLMDISLLKAPELIQWIYDKVTLPESLLFITHLKGLFGFAVMVISCLPALVLMGITGVVMSKAAEK